MQQLLTAFANAKATHISFSKNITTFAIFNDQSFNDTSTKDIQLSINGIELIKASFVCVEVLRPNQHNGVLSSTASLLNHTITGQYFMRILHQRMLPTPAGVEPATSWSPVGRASNQATEAG